MFNESAKAMRGGRAFRLLWTLTLMLLLLAARPAMAANSALCGATDVTVTNLPVSLSVSPGTPAGTALADVFTVKVTMTNCNGGDPTLVNISMYAAVALGTALTAASGVSGINYQIVGTPSYTTSGSCGSVALGVFSMQTQLNVKGTVSNCTMSLSVSGRYYLGTARIQGTQIISAPNGFAYGWANYCADAPACNVTKIYSPGNGATSSGIRNLLAWVPACAGVLTGTQTVQLPKVGVASLQNNSNPVGRTPFQISLAGCLTKANNGEAGNSGYDAYIVWSFVTCANTNTICNGGTSSARVQILKSDATTPVTNLVHNDVHVLTEGINTFQYYAAYVNPGGGVVIPGNISAQATLTVFYE